MKQLHKRLSIAMLAIVLLLGGSFYVIERVSSKLYYEELSQRLNSSLAMYVVNAKPLISNNVPDTEALSELASRAMIINPTAEIYLVDTRGEIMGHDESINPVGLSRISLAPVQKLLSGSDQFPIKGDDPRNPGTSKIFSAFPVSDANDPDLLAGYLYVVLGGAQYESIANTVSGSYYQRMVPAAIAVLVLTAFLAGALVFSVLTRRLRNLTNDVTQYASNEFSPDFAINGPASSTDEIDELRQACHMMSDTIASQMEGLKENDRLRRELVTNVSHDLRTPLASMQGYIETLLIKNESLDTNERLNYLQIARKHAVRLSSLIQDLFELAKLDSNRVTPDFEEFPMTELVQDVMQEFDLEARNKEIELQLEMPLEPITVYADIGLIQRVLENLVSNALKFTPAGGTITISTHKSDNRIDVSVEDTGPGIRDEDLPRIFDRFFRAELGKESNATSTGLGLAIAKRILELHDSRISVTSRIEEGTRFQFDLPDARLAA
jgi:signal transduction histidine kinase